MIGVHVHTVHTSSNSIRQQIIVNVDELKVFFTPFEFKFIPKLSKPSGVPAYSLYFWPFSFELCIYYDLAHDSANEAAVRISTYSYKSKHYSFM